MRAKRLFAAAVTTFFVLSITPVSARQSAAIMRACTGDVLRLCGGILPGGGRIKTCMKRNIKRLSAPCLDAVLDAIAAGKE
jgi:hypothetical protein